MVVFGGKKMRQMVVGFGGSGIGQVVAAVAISFLVRLFTSPGPVISPDDDDNDGGDAVPENGIHDDEAPPSSKVTPVIIRWNNINCSLSDKSSKSVSSCFFLPSFREC